MLFIIVRSRQPAATPQRRNEAHSPTAPHRHATVHRLRNHHTMHQHTLARTRIRFSYRISTNNKTNIVAKRTSWLNVQHPSPQGHASQIIFTPCASARILPATESATATAAANFPERAQAPCRLAHASQGRTVTAPTPASSHHRRLHYHHHHHLATAPDCTVTARVRHAGWPTR